MSRRFSRLSVDKSGGDDVEVSEIDQRDRQRPRGDGRSPAIQSRKVTRSVSQGVVIESDCGSVESDDSSNNATPVERSNKRGGKRSNKNNATAKKSVKESVLSEMSKNLVEKAIKEEKGKRSADKSIITSSCPVLKNDQESGTVRAAAAVGPENSSKPPPMRGNMKNDSIIIESDEELPPPPYSGPAQALRGSRRERGGQGREKREARSDTNGNTNNNNNNNNKSNNNNSDNNLASRNSRTNNNRPERTVIANKDGAPTGKGPSSNFGEKGRSARQPVEREGNRSDQPLHQNKRATDMLDTPQLAPQRYPPDAAPKRRPADINAPPGRTHTSNGGGAGDAVRGGSVFSRVESRGSDRGQRLQNAAPRPLAVATPSRALTAPAAKSAPVMKAAEPARETFVVEQVTAFSAPAERTAASNKGWADSDDDDE